MFAFVPCGKLQVLCGRLLSFFDEPVQQNHSSAFIDIEEHAGNLLSAEIAADFIETLPHWTTYRHSNGPAKLYSHDVDPNQLSIITGETL